MSAIAADPFEKLIRDSGEGWLIDLYAPRDRAIPYLCERLALANEAGHSRLGFDAPELTPESLVAAYKKNPHKVKAFLQVIGSVTSPDILVMVWRILLGVGIEVIRLEYDAKGQFQLYVRLSSSISNGAADEYLSKDIDDAVVLRHLGTLKIGNQGIFDGFYAFDLRQ